MYDHTFYKQVQIRRSDMRPHIKWAVSLVILHMITSIFLRALCGYIWVNILTLSPRGEAKWDDFQMVGGVMSASRLTSTAGPLSAIFCQDDHWIVAFRVNENFNTIFDNS